MIRPPTLAVALVLPLFLVSSGSATPLQDDPLHRHVRTADRRLQQLLDEGRLRSATLRTLVERLNQSDVVVYLLCESEPRSRVAGRMTFVSTVGGLRYVVIRIIQQTSRAHQIAILTHELRHAVEIADTPAIVDGPSLAREYARFGHANHASSLPGLAFDTQAAIDAGRQALNEVSAATGD